MMLWELDQPAAEPFDAAGFGRRVREAREAVSCSQAEAAKRLGMSQPTYSRLESGQVEASRVTATLMDGVSQLYGRPILYFLKGSPVRDRIRVAARSSSETAADIRELAAPVLDLLEADADLDELLDSSPVTSVDSPPWVHVVAQVVPAGHASRERGATAARCLRESLGLGSKPIEDMETLLEGDLGLEVGVLAFKPGLHAVAAFDDARAVALVAVEVTEPFVRQRFSLAHELAHVLFGDAHTERSDAGRRTAAELQADRFAQELLLPQAAVRDWAEARGYAGRQAMSAEDACVLADEFGVSPQTAWIALEGAGHRPAAEPPTTREAAIAAGHWTRFRQREAASRVPRVPARLEQRTLAAFRSGKINAARAASILFQDAAVLEDESSSLRQRRTSGAELVAHRR